MRRGTINAIAACPRQLGGALPGHHPVHGRPDADVRALVKRLRLPRQRANNGKALVAVAPRNQSPPEGHRTITGRAPPRKTCIKTLEAEVGRLEAAAAVHRADFERERERCDRLAAA